MGWEAHSWSNQRSLVNLRRAYDTRPKPEGYGPTPRHGAGAQAAPRGMGAAAFKWGWGVDSAPLPRLPPPRGHVHKSFNLNRRHRYNGLTPFRRPPMLPPRRSRPCWLRSHSSGGPRCCLAVVRAARHCPRLPAAALGGWKPRARGVLRCVRLLLIRSNDGVETGVRERKRGPSGCVSRSTGRRRPRAYACPKIGWCLGWVEGFRKSREGQGGGTSSQVEGWGEARLHSGGHLVDPPHVVASSTPAPQHTAC